MNPRADDKPSDLSFPPLTVAGRVIIVTGAGQGIGRAYALGLAEAGAHVVVADIAADRATEVAQQIVDNGGTALPFAVDVGNGPATAAMAQRIQDRFGRIDVLINNAALHVSLQRMPFWEIADETWDAVMRVNVAGCFRCSRAVVPTMRRGGWGRVINISSVAALVGQPNYLHYVTSKSAMIGMTRSMARELSGTGVTVNAILPGQILTEVDNPAQTTEAISRVLARQIVQRSGTPDDMLGLLIYLASPASDFVTGQSFVVDGGLTHL
ncbi:MAG: 3-oxoacyl-ACP reductase FabG [Rhizobiales bacterium]|nr:3-oxoacyl-ACP reductase FabG [Hyphomicrobiales bacterium]OJY46997.1 MAG: hypothetical protein BGP08_03000 [Rhizobiales bacterium 64-17]